MTSGHPETSECPMDITPITEDYHSQGFIMSLRFSLLGQDNPGGGTPPNLSKLPVTKQLSKASDWREGSSCLMKWVLGVKLDSVNHPVLIPKSNREQACQRKGAWTKSPEKEPGSLGYLPDLLKILSFLRTSVASSAKSGLSRWQWKPRLCFIRAEKGPVRVLTLTRA